MWKEFNSVMRKEMIFLVLLFLVLLFLIIAGTGIPISGEVVSAGGLEVSSILLKVSVIEGDSVEKSIFISSEERDEIRLEMTSAIGVSLLENNFVIDSGERREVKIFFDSSSLENGVYVGNLRIISRRSAFFIPIVFEIESEDVFFDVTLEIPPEYTQVSPGEKMVSNVKIFDLTGFRGSGSLDQTSVDVEYIIQGIGGEILSFESENIIIDQQAQFTKTLVLPEGIEAGDYFISVIVKYGSSVGTSNQLFIVEEDRRSFFRIFNNVSVAILSFIIIFVLGMIFLFIYLIHDRDKIFLELRKHNSLELRKQREFLSDQKKAIVKKAIVKEKPRVKRKVKKEVREKIKKLKHKHKKRIKEFRKLRKSGNVNKMKRQLNKWKSSGYNTFSLKYKLKGLSSKDMKSLMGKWKKQGYKTKAYKNNK